MRAHAPSEVNKQACAASASICMIANVPLWCVKEKLSARVNKSGIRAFPQVKVRAWYAKEKLDGRVTTSPRAHLHARKFRSVRGAKGKNWMGE